MNPILSESELEHDLEVLIKEYQASNDAWGQMPSMSYTNNVSGCINLRNLVKLAVKKIELYRQKEFPKMYFSVEKYHQFTCSRCSGKWSIKDWTRFGGPSQICPHCGYLGEVQPAEGKVDSPSDRG